MSDFDREDPDQQPPVHPSVQVEQWIADIEHTRLHRVSSDLRLIDFCANYVYNCGAKHLAAIARFIVDLEAARE